MLQQVVRPYVRATPSLQGAQLYLLAKVIIFHQFSTFLCLLFEGQHLRKFAENKPDNLRKTDGAGEWRRVGDFFTNDGWSERGVRKRGEA